MCNALRILVVDDCRDTAAMLGTLLQQSGYVVETALDGRSAIEAADRFRPDVVLLDLVMPVVSGYTVAEMLRESASHASTLIVALTGLTKDSDRLKALKAGFDDYLIKPASVTDLLRVMRRHCRAPDGGRAISND